MASVRTVKQQVIYTNAEVQVTVYKGVMEPGTLPVAIKEHLHTSLVHANASINEAMVQARLSHRCICRVFSCYLEEGPGGTYKSVIVTELLHRDLMLEIDARRSSSRYWTDSELMSILSDFVSALSAAERAGISHRDIKPQNIFVTEDTLKIGDFGSSTELLDLSQYRATIQGSPFFLSPELKQAYVSALASHFSPLHYDPVKSDVYSLGLTLLFMATLSPPASLLNLQSLPEATATAIANLSWLPSLQAYLRCMLAVDPADRPTFLQMEQWLHAVEPAVAYPQTNSICCICQSPFVSASEEALTCSFECEGQRCLNCSQRIVDCGWIAQHPKKGISLKKRLCSISCYTQLVKVRTKSCVSCQAEIVSKEEAVILSCAHVFHSLPCLAAYCRQVSAPRHCPSCRKPLPPSLVAAVLGELSSCFLCQTTSAVAQACGHSLCTACGRTGKCCRAKLGE